MLAYVRRCLSVAGVALVLGGFGSAIVFSVTEVTNGAESSCGTLVLAVVGEDHTSLCGQPLRERTKLVVACLAIAVIGASGLWRAGPPRWAIGGGVVAGSMAVAAALVAAVPGNPAHGDCGSVLGPYSYAADVIGCEQIDHRRTLAFGLLYGAIALVLIGLVVARRDSDRRSTVEAHGNE